MWRTSAAVVAAFLLLASLPVSAEPAATRCKMLWDYGAALKSQGWFFREAKGKLAAVLTERMNGFEPKSNYRPDHVWYAAHFSAEGDLDPPILLLLFVVKDCVKAEGAIREDAFYELAGRPT